MDLYTKVEETLNKLTIPFEIVEHEPALTTEQADSFIEGIEGVRTKTMFLTNKRKLPTIYSLWTTKNAWTWTCLKNWSEPIKSAWHHLIVYLKK